MDFFPIVKMSNGDSDEGFMMKANDISLPSSDDDDDIFYFNRNKKSLAKKKTFQFTDIYTNANEENIDNSDISNIHGTLEKKLEKLSQSNNELFPCILDSEYHENKSLPKSGKSTLQDVVLLLSSDDSNDEDVYVSYVSENVYVADSLMKAKKAQAELLRIQSLHSHEKNIIDIISSDEDNNFGEEQIVREITREISVKLRTKMQFLPKGYERLKSSLHKNTITIYIDLHDKIHFLVQKYRDEYKSLNIPTSTISFHFDGQIMNPDLTPLDYELEDDDLIDVIVDLSVKELPDSEVELQAKDVEINNRRIKIKTSIRGGNPQLSHIYQLRLTDKFRKITDVYRQKHGYSSVKPLYLHHNNKKLNLDERPIDCNIISDVFIEIIDETERLNQVGKMITSSSCMEVTGDVDHRS